MRYTQHDDGYFAWPKHVAAVTVATIKLRTDGYVNVTICNSG